MPPTAPVPSTMFFARWLLLALFLCAACGGGAGKGALAPGPSPEQDRSETGSTGEIHDRRVLLIGLDAADEEMIGPLIRSGKLPAIARFYREGATGPLRSHRPMLSPILWTSIATGVSPERHGILDFVDEDAAGRMAPIGSGARTASTFWEILGDAGVRVAVVGWLATFPATPLNGELVSDRFTIHPFEPPEAEPRADPRGKTFPPQLVQEISRAALGPGQLTSDQLTEDFGLSFPAPGAGRPAARDADERALRVVSSTTRTYAAVAESLIRKKDLSLVAVYFDGVDRLLHIFSDVAPPPLKGSDKRRAARYGHVVDAFYSAVDRVVGRLAEAAGPEATLLIVSDHGWKTGAARPSNDPRREGPYAAEWHRDRGILLARGHGIRAGARLEEADIYDITPTLLAIYGAAPAKDFRGKALAGLFVPGFLTHSPPPVAAYPRAAGAPGHVPVGKAEDEEARVATENLRSLGYVGSGGGSKSRGPAEPRGRWQVNLATVYVEEKKYPKAIALYERYLEKHAQDYDALYNLAFARREAGDPEKATEAYRAAAKLRPAQAEPWIGLGEMEMRRNRWAEAREAFRAAGALEPDNAAVWNYLGAAACETGEVEEGIRDFRKAISLSPRSASPYVNLSRVLDRTGRRAEAVALLREGLVAAPGDERLTRRLTELGTPTSP